MQFTLSSKKYLIVSLSLTMLGMFLFPALKPLAAAELRQKKEFRPQDMKELRKESALRKRRIIFNNDGDDAYPFNRYKFPIKDFLNARSTGLIGSQVDTIFYSTACSFGYFNHRSKSGYTRLARESISLGRTRYNVVPDLIELGTDPLQLMVQFCRKNKIEIFWSLRMNDTHDSGSEDYAKYDFSPWKKAHPDSLAGSRDRKPPHGGWAAVDYAQPEIRDAAFQFCKEVCQNYDIDGLELDFYRHPHIFKHVAWGGKITQAELDMMTALLRRIRNMADAEAMRKGHPILVAVRVPDSLEYCHDIGIDLEEWLRQGLIDILTTGEIFQLNPWTFSVDLGHRYGVPVYACLAGSRVKGESQELPATMQRNSMESYRGFALQAWQSGVDGIYLFNFNYLFKPESQLWCELGDPQSMLTKGKTYFVTPLGKGRAGYLLEALDYIKVPLVSPDAPLRVFKGRKVVLPIMLAEDMNAAGKAGFRPEVQCLICVKKLAERADLSVKLNGCPLTSGELVGEWLKYRIDPACLNKGANLFELVYQPENSTSANSTKPDAQQIAVQSIGNAESIFLHDLFLSVNYFEKTENGNSRK